MSEYLKNRQLRQQKLQEIILRLHQGARVEDVKEEFRDLLNAVGPSEIAKLEQALIRGGLPEEEVKRLCDVHVSLFQESLDAEADLVSVPGHPLHTFRAENDAIQKLIEAEIRPLFARLKAAASHTELTELLALWREKHTALSELEKHYSREENLLFPYLEKYGLSGPPSVMWSIHDDIRDQLKQVADFLADNRGELTQEQVGKFIDEVAEPLVDSIMDMIYRENKILYKFSADTLTEADWQAIRDESDEIGYTLIKPQQGWEPKTAQGASAAPQSPAPEGTINFETGSLSPREIELILNNLPVDITFVDQDNVVRYFSKPKDRIFTRTKAVIGRKVELCHPPESVHVVTKIIEEFRAGRKDTAEFWLTLGESFVYIRYFAVRDENQKYLGVLEVTQEVSGIRGLQGEKRLLEW